MICKVLRIEPDTYALFAVMVFLCDGKEGEGRSWKETWDSGGL